MNELKDSKQDKKKSGNDVIDLAKKMKNSDKIIDLTEELITPADEPKKAVSLAPLSPQESEDEITEIDSNTKTISANDSTDEEKESEPVENIVLDLTDDPNELEFQQDATAMDIGSPIDEEKDSEAPSPPPFDDFIDEPLMPKDNESLESKASSYDFLSNVDEEDEKDVSPEKPESDENLMNHDSDESELIDQPSDSLSSGFEPVFSESENENDTDSEDEGEIETDNDSENDIGNVEAIKEDTESSEDKETERSDELLKVIGTPEVSDDAIETAEESAPLPNLLHFNQSPNLNSQNQTDFDLSQSLGVPLDDERNETPSTESISPENEPSQSDSLFEIVDKTEEIIDPVSIPQEQIESALERVVDKMFTERIEKMMHEVIEKAVQKEIEEIKKALIEEDL